MTSKKFIKFLITLIALSLLVAIPALAQGPGEEPVGNGDEGAQNSAPADTAQDAPVESTDDSGDEGAQNSAPADVESTNVEQAGGAVEEFDSVGLESLGSAVEAASDAQPSGLLAGSFSTEVIAIANTGGAAGTGQIQMSQIGDGAGTANLTVDSIFAGGVKFFAPSDQGEWAGVLSTDFAAQVAVLTVNATAKSADMYRGFDSNAIAKELYGPIVYNDHVGWASLLYCQNADSATQDIKAELYEKGTNTPAHTFNATAVASGKGVKWDVAKDATDWTGGDNHFGFVKFSGSTGPIACVVDGQNSKNNWNASYSAVPSSYGASELTVPLVYNGHGLSQSTDRNTKLNSGFAIVNLGGATTASVKFTAQNLKAGDTRAAYEVTCTANVAANGSVNWFTPLVWKDGFGGLWTCNKPFPLEYELNYNSFGTVKLTASNGGTLLGITNHSQNDTPVGTSAQQTAFSSLGTPTAKATNKSVCPLATKPSDDTNKFITGIRIANVGASDADVTLKFVKQGVDPSVSGNTVPVVKTIKAGQGVTNFLPSISEVAAGFEGAVFIEGPSGSQILATANGLNNKNITAQGMYDCINY